MRDLELSVARTPTQAVLRIVSILMGIMGALVLVGGLLVLVPSVIGGSDFWESGIVHPDIVLRDLVTILHPE